MNASDPSNIGIRSTENYISFATSLHDGFYLPFQQRSGAVDIGVYSASNFGNDGYQTLCSNTTLHEFNTIDILPFDYSKAHKDQFQTESRDKKFNITPNVPIENIYIGKANCYVRGDNKQGFMFSGENQYKNVILFPNGVIYDSDSTYEYIVDLTNLYKGEFGSPENPIDPERISNKAFRISGRKGKDKAPKSGGKIVFHIYDGVDIRLDESAKKCTKIIKYPRALRSEEDRVIYYSEILESERVECQN